MTIIFFILTLGITWGFGFLPKCMGITDTSFGTFLFYFGGGAPSVVALFIVFLTYTKEQKSDYFKRCFSFRYMGLKWPLITIAFFLSITVLSLFIAVGIMGYDMPGMDFVNAAISNPLNIILILLISLISGPLNEEFGWRGFALDRLLFKYGYGKASAILGFIWAIWHLPWYFTPGQAQYALLQKSVFDAVMYIPAVMLLSYIVTFVYIKTNRSILAGAMIHMFANLFGSQLLSPYSEEVGMTIRYVKMVCCIAVIAYAFHSKTFKKETANVVAGIEKAYETNYETCSR